MLTYAKMNIPDRSIRERNTKETAQCMCIKNELKFLYKKKQNINKELYRAHLHNAYTWNSIWEIIKEKINDKLEPLMRKKYENINKKITNRVNRKEKKNSMLLKMLTHFTQEWKTTVVFSLPPVK